jgi:hypothetical protein
VDSLTCAFFCLARRKNRADQQCARRLEQGTTLFRAGTSTQWPASPRSKLQARAGARTRVRGVQAASQGSIDAPGAGKGNSQETGCPSDCPVSMNDSGALTGVYIANNVFHVYLRSPEGNIVTVQPAGSSFTSAAGIND